MKNYFDGNDPLAALQAAIQQMTDAIVADAKRTAEEARQVAEQARIDAMEAASDADSGVIAPRGTVIDGIVQEGRNNSIIVDGDGDENGGNVNTVRNVTQTGGRNTIIIRGSGNYIGEIIQD